VRSFNAGTGINAPAVTFAANGKQYVAVLAGSAMRDQVLGIAPELRNNLRPRCRSCSAFSGEQTNAAQLAGPRE
jgi:hypothetical protein